MKKILFLGFFSITSLLGFSQLRIPIKIFSAHEETCHGGVRTTFNDYVIKIYSDSTIEILNYRISTPIEFSAFKKSIYFGMYELKKDSIVVKNLCSSTVTKYKNPLVYSLVGIPQELSLILNAVFIIKEESITSNLFPTLLISNNLITSQIESKFHTWDRIFIGNKFETRFKFEKENYLNNF